MSTTQPFTYSIPAPQVKGGARTILLPDGTHLTVPEVVWVAFSFFAGDGKPSGSVTISFKNGNVAGVDTSTRCVLK